MRTVCLAACLSIALAASATASAQTEEKVTAATLPKLLQGLGYEPEKVGETAQRLTIERAKFNFKINFSISGNEKKLWMSSYLVQIPDLTKVPAKLLSDLLVANSEIGPAHFYLVKLDDGKHWLKMGFALDNRNITPAYLRSEMDWFMDKMSETADLWNKEKWDAATKA